MSDKQTIAVLLVALERLVRAIETNEHIDEDIMTLANVAIGFGRGADERQQRLERLTPEMQDVIARVRGKEGG